MSEEEKRCLCGHKKAQHSGYGGSRCTLCMCRCWQEPLAPIETTDPVEKCWQGVNCNEEKCAECGAPTTAFLYDWKAARQKRLGVATVLVTTGHPGYEIAYGEINAERSVEDAVKEALENGYAPHEIHVWTKAEVDVRHVEKKVSFELTGLDAEALGSKNVKT